MSNRLKEDEKNEKIIRGLLKLPANKRCINCNNLGPQYVCTNFWIFICTNCSGIHREFTHRVKSISMAKFSTQEVNALKEGGNERAREILFKDWDPQRHSFPDNSNIDRLRDFIKHVYVDRRYSGGRNSDEPQRAKGETEAFSEFRKTDVHRGGSRSPAYEDERRSSYSDQSGSGGRNDDKSTQYGYEERSPSQERSPNHPEVSYDRQRDEKFGNGEQIRRFDDRRLPNALQKTGGGSPNYQKENDASSPPMVRPVREILGDDVPKLQVGEVPKLSVIKGPEPSSKTRRTGSSSSIGSGDSSNTVELKRANSGSLIDFIGDSEPSISKPSRQTVPQQSKTSPSSDGNWASFDFTQQQIAQSSPPTSTSSLESVLSGLSAPATVGSSVNNSNSSPASSINALFLSAESVPTNLTSVPASGPPSNVSWGPPTMAPNVQGISIAPSRPPFPSNNLPPQVSSGGLLPTQTKMEVKSLGRKELPEDFFTSIYPSAMTPFPGWQRAPSQFGTGYGMHYHANIPMPPTFTQAPRPSNPFDLSSEPSLPQSSSFPNMATLQAALPNVAENPPPLHRASSLGAPPTQQWFPQQPFSSSSLHPSQYMLQQGPTTPPLQMPLNFVPGMYPGTAISGQSFVSPSGILGMEPQPGTPSRLPPAGGNPFG